MACMKRAMISILGVTLTKQPFHTGVIIAQRCKVRIVLPKVWAWCAHVRNELTWVAKVKIPNRRRQHQRVAGGLIVVQNHSARRTHICSLRHSP